MKRSSALVALLAATAAIAVFYSSTARAIDLPAPPIYQEQIDILSAQYDELKNELQALERELSPSGDPQNFDDDFKDRVTRLFSLMEKLAENRNALQALKAELADLFKAPPSLKLVRISGPEPGARDAGMGAQAEIVYTPNNAGFSWQEKTTDGRTISNMAMAVTYAPLEIIPGEPFHFEAEARQAYDWDAPDCSGSSPFRIHIGVNPNHDILRNSEFDFQGWPVAESRQDLRCQPGTVDISVRFKAEPPTYWDGFQKWLFPYTMEVTTNGIPHENSAFRASIKDVFKLESRKSAVDLSDRSLYKYDVDVRPGPSSFGGAKITLHYRAVDESIAFLPTYRFPEDTRGFAIKVPDVRGLSRTEAVKELSTRRLDAKIVESETPPDNESLVGKVATQKPQAGDRLKANSKVILTLYPDYSNMDCTAYGGSVPVWEQTQNRHLCGCSAGYIWSADRTHCEKELPPDQLCAARHPGSVADGRGSNGKVNCSCPGGYTWSADMTHCEKLIPPDQLCAGHYTGSISTGRGSDGKVICGCPNGFTWSADRTHCVTKLSPDQVCARDFRGSIARGVLDDGRINCVCPDGQTWSSDRTHCVKKLSPDQVCSRDFPGSIARGRLNDGRINCVCPQGYGWTANNTRCVRQSSGNRDNSGSGDSQRCSDLLFKVKSFMDMYRGGSASDTYPKNIAEGFAQQARAAGCDQGKINQSLGGGTGTGHTGDRSGGGGPRCICPSGTVPSETFGQSGCINPNTGRKVPEVCS